VEFRILGPLEVRAGGVRVALGGPRAETVLAVLLLDAGRLVPIERLVEAVWDDDAPVTARRQVQNRVSDLRRVLGAAGAPGAIATEGAGYRLVVPDGAVDVRVFDRLVAEAEAADAAGLTAEAAGLLRSALALWRGPALAGWAAGWSMRPPRG
jgi:DNA-binding SARP family transcriptional activator